MSARDDVHEVPTLPGSLLDPRDGAAPLALVVDDDASARDVVSELLAVLGCGVLVAADGEEALRTAWLTKPDLIVIDMSMPRLDGAEATACLRRHPSTARTPVLAMTAFRAPWESRARDVRCDAFFEKPLDLGALRETVLRLVPALRSSG